MSDYLEQVKSAIDAMVFHSSSSYSWLGRESARLSPRIRRAMTARTERNYLLYQLQSQLYTDFYIRGGVSRGWSGDRSYLTDGVAFVESLSAANAGSGSWEGGWEVLTVTPDELVVRRGGLTLWVGREDCAVEDSRAIEPGTRLKLRLPKELLSISPGYHMVLSDQGSNSYDAQELVRLYWNLRAEGATSFIRTATLLLNDAQQFFKLKILSDPVSYTRCDAAVVYFRRRDYQKISEIMLHVYAEVVRYLKDGVPTFTKLIAPGVGLAEDPGLTESFGQHRCRLLADGMIRAYEQGARRLDERLRFVTDSFASAGIRLEQPYLNPNSPDVYVLPGWMT